MKGADQTQIAPITQAEILRHRNSVLEDQVAQYRHRELLYNALRQLQEEIWKMQRAEDIQKVLQVLQKALGDLEIAYRYCSVNVVDTHTTPPTVSAFNIARKGPPQFFPIKKEAAQNIVQFWQDDRPVYRKNLMVEDPYGETQYMEGNYSVLDVPFSHGTLALSSTVADAFSAGDIATLQELANAISSVYSRYLDFQKIERQNLQLTIERAAEHVRAAVSKMKTAAGLKEVVEVMLEELIAAEVAFDLCVINIIDEQAGVCRQYGITPLGWAGQIDLPLSKLSEAFLSVYKGKKTVVRPVDETLAKRHFETRKELGISTEAACPTAIAEAPFAYGTLSLSTQHLEGFGQKDTVLLSEFARVLELGYARFQDFERIETQKGLNRALSGQGGVGEFISASEGLAQLEAQIDQVAPTDLTVLILGETGTGKGVAARAIHAHSQRSTGPLIQVNCGAITQGLVESELFGHEKGAFTGATARQLGKIELAEGGTLFLDEIGDMPLDAQVKLLQVLQERTFERVGGNQTLKANARIVAATNRDLAKMVAEGTFREDLFFRLETFPLQIPPLRHRRADIPLLVRYFAQDFARHLNRSTPQISAQAMAQLQAYRWPGNVRELEHLIQRAVLLCKKDCIEVQDVTVGLNEGEQPVEKEEVLSLVESEKRHIARALAQTNGVISGAKGAAKLLDIHPETLRSRMRKYGLL